MLENLVLRQQLLVLKRKQPRPRLCLLDKLFWVLVHKFWSGWKKEAPSIEGANFDLDLSKRPMASSGKCGFGSEAIVASGTMLTVLAQPATFDHAAAKFPDVTIRRGNALTNNATEQKKTP